MFCFVLLSFRCVGVCGLYLYVSCCSSCVVYCWLLVDGCVLVSLCWFLIGVRCLLFVVLSYVLCCLGVFVVWAFDIFVFVVCSCLMGVGCVLLWYVHNVCCLLFVVRCS